MEKQLFQQRTKVMVKLYESGCLTEKVLQKLSMADILQIPGITVADMNIILELQGAVKDHTLFSYLGGDGHEQSGEGQAHHLE